MPPCATTVVCFPEHSSSCRFIASLRALGEKDAALREARVLRIEKEDLKDQRVESDRKVDEVMTAYLKKTTEL